MTRVKQTVFASAVCLVFAAPATAGYINFCGAVCSTDADISVGAPMAFSLLGSAWNPGPGTARIGGNPAPGWCHLECDGSRHL